MVIGNKTVEATFHLRASLCLTSGSLRLDTRASVFSEFYLTSIILSFSVVEFNFISLQKHSFKSELIFSGLDDSGHRPTFEAIMRL